MNAALKEKVSFFITKPADVTAAKRAAKSLAKEVGFDDKGSEEVTLVVSELASNIHKHAGRGSLSVTPMKGGGGLIIEAKDRGPGIGDENKAFTDGYSTSGTLGDGLGAVNRLVDSLEIASDGTSGTHIIAEKRLHTAPLPPTARGKTARNPFDVGGASRAHKDLSQNGDAFAINHWPGHTLITVIDGLGHGQYAHKAAITARTYVETHRHLPLDEIFKGCARACRGTRGVVMALTLLSWADKSVQFASVGNIEVRMFNSERSKLVTVRRGVVGMQMPKPRVIRDQWQDGQVMVLHSDGVGSNWRYQAISASLGRPSSVIARKLVTKYGKENDDATVVVVKEKPIEDKAETAP